MTGTFNGGTVKALRDSMQNALAEFEQKFDVKVHVSHARYTATSINFKVEVANIVDGQVKDQETVDFENRCLIYGFKPEDLGSRFTSQGETYSITGLSRRAHKYPILCKQIRTGKTFKFPARTVKQCLGEPGIVVS